MTEIDKIAPDALGTARDWILRLSSTEVTATELAALRQWLADDVMHRRAFERERSFWQDLEPHRALFDAPSLSQPNRRHGGTRWLRRPPRRIWAPASAIAASLALLLSAPDLILRYRADHIAAAGQTQAILLPDRSMAMLDSGSALAIRYSGTERRIELLKGRAWFDVKHDDARPFRVAALGGVVEDIGTAYEVARENDGVDVAVSQGAVRVTAGKGHSVVLRTGERARYADADTEMLSAVSPDRIAAWRSGEVLIDNMSVDQAVRQIARYRQGKTFLWSSPSASQRVSGVFRTDRPDDGLAAIAKNAGLRIRRLPAGIVILH